MELCKYYQFLEILSSLEEISNAVFSVSSAEPPSVSLNYIIHIRLDVVMRNGLIFSSSKDCRNAKTLFKAIFSPHQPVFPGWSCSLQRLNWHVEFLLSIIIFVHHAYNIRCYNNEGCNGFWSLFQFIQRILPQFFQTSYEP